MMDTNQRPSVASADLLDRQPKCHQCGKPFEPRSKSGGKPQRFCSPECRAAFHTQPQRSQRSPTCSAPSLPAVVDQPKPKDEPAAPAKDSEDFDWSDDSVVVIREQPETAIYFNPAGGLVIRQRNGWDEDVYVYINARLIDTFIDKLCDVVGIPSAGRT
jgi:hypothetical protein